MYEIIIERTAEKQLAKLPRDVGRRIARQIDALADNPRPPGCLKLTNRDDEWRVRVGRYRVIYRILDGVLVVRVIKVAHRNDAYD